MGKENRRIYKNANITVFWDLDLCNHATICFTKLARVFNPRQRPWINLENSTDEKIIGIVNECPTLALTFCWNNPDKNKTETSPKLLRDNGEGFLECDKIESVLCKKGLDKINKEKVVKIKVIPSGPLVVLGDFTMVDEDGNEEGMERLSLCVCGKSRRKHICDGSHFLKNPKN